MGALQRYILRSATTSFLASLLAVTGIVWVSQALRDFDLMTSKGQSFWTFLGITLLAVPSFALIVTPFALFGAVVFVLNRLNTDSELAAISAAGVRPVSLLSPFLTLTLVVSIAAGALSLSAIPASLRVIREMLTEIRADIVVNILREGEFTNLDNKVTLHVRRREAGAALTGLLIDDNRTKGENTVYTAESGQVLKTNEGTFLLLRNGAMQRKIDGETDPSLVVFDSYAFDLSPFAADEAAVIYKPRELYVSELWNPDSKSKGQTARRLKAELHERLVSPLFPLAFMCIAFAALSRPRTTRQGRFTSIIFAIVAIMLVRLAGLGLVNLSKTEPWAVPLLYGVPLAVSAGALIFAMGISNPFRTAPRRPAPA
jgi:lipopolysaccharide export system permease protein